MIDLWVMRENYSIVTIECKEKNSEFFFSFFFFSSCLPFFKGLLLKSIIPQNASSLSLASTLGNNITVSLEGKEGNYRVVNGKIYIYFLN